MEDSVKMSNNSNHVEMIKQNRNVLLVVLMLPVVGMAISILLIYWRFPHLTWTAIPIISLLMLQYLLLVRWIKRKIDV